MSRPNSKANEGLIDNIWGLLIDSSRMQFLDEYMGDMNAPLMITMGAMSMPQTNEELADALGVSKSEALKFISQWAYDNGITDHQLYTESKASEGRYKVEDKTYDDLEEAKVMADMTDNPVLDSQEDNRPIYDGGTYRTESKASEYYGENEPDKLLPTIRCEKCHDIIRGEFDQETKQKAHDHLINEHQYTWLPTKRKFEHDEQNRVYQKMMSNMEYSKANYSNSVFESKASEFGQRYFHSLDASAEDIMDKWLEDKWEGITADEISSSMWDELEKTDGGSRFTENDIQNYIDEYFDSQEDGEESKASEGFYDGKTFTCDKCGKVGDSFTDMAQEECPADVRLDGISSEVTPLF